MALTDTAVRQAKTAEDGYTMTDGMGLSLYVAPNGTKSWHFRFVWHDKQPRISLGTYPEISLKDARILRDEQRALVAKGIDPREARRSAKSEAAAASVNTFEAVANEWHEFKTGRWTQGRKGSSAQSRRTLDKDLIPKLGDRPFAEIKRADLASLLAGIERRGAPHVATKARSWLNQIFRYGMAKGLRDDNPASDLDIVAMPLPPTQHHPILAKDGEQLPKFLRAVRTYDGSPVTRIAARLLLLTAVRTGEMRHSAPGDFDLEKALWVVPPDGVKQLRGKVRKEGEDIPPYLVPLSRQAVEEVSELLKMTGRYQYAFAGRNNPDRPMSENTVNQAIKRMGFGGMLTGHGIRGTFSTAMNEMGFQDKYIEAQLSHADQNKARGAYNHAMYVEERREMMQAWADMLDELEAKGS